MDHKSTVGGLLNRVHLDKSIITLNLTKVLIMMLQSVFHTGSISNVSSQYKIAHHPSTESQTTQTPTLM